MEGDDDEDSKMSGEIQMRQFRCMLVRIRSSVEKHARIHFRQIIGLPCSWLFSPSTFDTQIVLSM